MFHLLSSIEKLLANNHHPIYLPRTIIPTTLKKTPHHSSKQRAYRDKRNRIQAMLVLPNTHPAELKPNIVGKGLNVHNTVLMLDRSTGKIHAYNISIASTTANPDSYLLARVIKAHTDTLQQKTITKARRKNRPEESVRDFFNFVDLQTNPHLASLSTVGLYTKQQHAFGQESAKRFMAFVETLRQVIPLYPEPDTKRRIYSPPHPRAALIPRKVGDKTGLIPHTYTSSELEHLRKACVEWHETIKDFIPNQEFLLLQEGYKIATALYAALHQFINQLDPTLVGLLQAARLLSDTNYNFIQEALTKNPALRTAIEDQPALFVQLMFNQSLITAISKNSALSIPQMLGDLAAEIARPDLPEVQVKQAIYRLLATLQDPAADPLAKAIAPDFKPMARAVSKLARQAMPQNAAESQAFHELYRTLKELEPLTGLSPATALDQISDEWPDFTKRYKVISVERFASYAKELAFDTLIPTAEKYPHLNAHLNSFLDLENLGCFTRALFRQTEITEQFELAKNWQERREERQTLLIASQNEGSTLTTPFKPIVMAGYRYAPVTDYDLMREQLSFINEDMPKNIEHQMIRNNMHYFAITKQGNPRILGYISLNDITRHKTQTRFQVQTYDTLDDRDGFNAYTHATRLATHLNNSDILKSDPTIATLHDPLRDFPNFVRERHYLKQLLRQELPVSFITSGLRTIGPKLYHEFWQNQIGRANMLPHNIGNSATLAEFTAHAGFDDVLDKLENYNGWDKAPKRPRTPTRTDTRILNFEAMLAAR